AALTRVAPLHHLAEEQVGVVVALLRPAAELAGAVQEPPDARHRVGAEQGELQRARDVEGELVAGAEVDDALVVPPGTERLDLLSDAGSAHRSPLVPA